MKLKDIIGYIFDKDKCKICVIDVKNKNKFVEIFLGSYDKKTKDYANASVVSIVFCNNIVYIDKI